MDYVIAYLGIVNVVAFLLYGLDKQKARMNRWRIPEKVLLGVAAFGGTIGAYVGMRMFHHKTTKAKFYIGIPLIFILQVVAVVVIEYYF